MTVGYLFRKDYSPSFYNNAGTMDLLKHPPYSAIYSRSLHKNYCIKDTFRILNHAGETDLEIWNIHIYDTPNWI